VPITYSQIAINYRLNGVVSAIDAGGGPGTLRLLTNGGAVLSTVTLGNPAGTVNGGVLTFSTPEFDLGAAGTGLAFEGRIYDANGNPIISGLTVGIPASGANIILANGQNSVEVTAGQVVELLSGQITGS
jgi:hypothetical protein